MKRLLELKKALEKAKEVKGAACAEGKMKATVTRLNIERAEAEAEIERLKARLEQCEAALREYANRDNWGDDDINKWIEPMTNGPDYARAALEE